MAAILRIGAVNDAAALVVELGAFVRAGATAVVCDLSTVVSPDAGVVDALARLQLAARRLGCELRLRCMSTELAELLDFAGLAAVLGVEVGWQAEEREQGLGVEKERELDDPVS